MTSQIKPGVWDTRKTRDKRTAERKVEDERHRQLVDRLRAADAKAAAEEEAASGRKRETGLTGARTD